MYLGSRRKIHLIGRMERSVMQLGPNPCGCLIYVQRVYVTCGLVGHQRPAEDMLEKMGVGHGAGQQDLGKLGELMKQES